MNSFMAASPMMSSYYLRPEQPTSPGNPGSSGVTQRRPVVRAPREEKPKPKVLNIPKVDPALYMHRHNHSREARGTFRFLSILDLKLYFSTDFWIGVIPMGVTVVLIIANMALVWEEVGWREYFFTLGMLVTTFSSYLLTTTTDPGIYPRLRPGEADPLESNMELVFCKKCLLRRPPRCAHCYHCDVCVLEHDHHCTILGGCVGVRNLRWFTLYLLSCCASTMIGVVWLSRSLFEGVFNYDESDSTASTTPHPTKVGGRRSFEEGDRHSGKHLLQILFLLLDCIVVMLVGGMLFIYLYLALTDTTRRESMRKQNSVKALLQPTLVWRNIKKVANPPPSLLNADGHADEETTHLI